MKMIEHVDLVKCFKDAEEQVKEELAANVTKQIKAQLMAAAQLKIKANHSVAEADKLQKQLSSKEQIIARIQAGDWDALPDSAKERDDVAKDKE